MVSSVKEARGYTYDTFAKACGGVPARQRLFQLINAPLKNFPDPETIRGLALGTGYSVTDIILAAARSLGLSVRDTDPDSVRVSGLSALPASAREAYLHLGRELTSLATVQEQHDPAPPVQGQPTNIRDAGKRSNARSGQKIRRGLSAVPSNPDAPADGNIPLPDNWEDLAAYTGPTGHKDRESEWAKRGEESQDSDDES